MSTCKKILIADDDSAILVSLRLLLEQHHFEVIQANTPQEVMYLAAHSSPDLLLLDMNYSQDTTSGSEGLALLTELHQAQEHLPIVVMTGWATIELAVAAMQQGANDFIQKPWDNQRLLNIINAQLTIAEGQQIQARLSRENQALKDDLSQQQVPMIAQSAQMQGLLAKAMAAAQSDVGILITGENGTGKSMLAEYLHQSSARAQHSLIKVNMGAIPESLFESELFGHAKGAFTDAKTKRIGRVALAEGGTLFLDEIGNLPLAQQAKLLHLIENKSFEAVGNSDSQVADVRIIAATNADLEQMVAQQAFRMDLLYRLNTVTLHLPALRQRQEDILPLAKAFCEQMARKYQKSDLVLSDNAMQALINYAWPGNVRELSHVIERAVIFASDKLINADALMLQESALVENQSKSTRGEIAATHDSLQPLAEIEEALIVARLRHFDGNAVATAESLGLSRSAFYRRLDKYKIHHP